MASGRIHAVGQEGTFEVGSPNVGKVAGTSHPFTPAGAQRHATSVWFEDVVGHVSTPDEIDFGA